MPVPQPQSSITTQAKCDMSKPEEHLLWGLAQIPMGNNMMPVQPTTARAMSKHLHELGFRHHPKLQTKKLAHPKRGSQSNYNGLSQWVPMDAEEPTPMMLPDVQAMTTEEREWLHKELEAVGHIRPPSPDLGPLAQVTDASMLVRPFERRATTAEELGK